jgi:hypothetical protein
MADPLHQRPFFKLVRLAMDMPTDPIAELNVQG